jgi:hypothetical protein
MTLYCQNTNTATSFGSGPAIFRLYTVTRTQQVATCGRTVESSKESTWVVGVSVHFMFLHPIYWSAVLKVVKSGMERDSSNAGK